MIGKSLGMRTFNALNYGFLVILGVICLLPVVHVISVSFSASSEVAAGNVYLLPVKFQTAVYTYVLAQPQVSRSLMISVIRVVLGYLVCMSLAILTAYPLSKHPHELKFRTGYAWYFFITMLFSGGIVPLFMVVKYTGLMDTIFALILPGAVNVMNVILLLSFFRRIPKEMEESAFIDGAGHFRILVSIYIPVSTAAIATVSLFTIVWHWNSWFDGMLFMNQTKNYPFQTYLQTVIHQPVFNSSSLEEMKQKSLISDRTIRCAQVVLGAIPIMMVYPFLQKYFAKGIMLGSVKG